MEKNMKTQTLHRQLKSKTDSRDSEKAVIGGLLFEPCLDEVLGTGLISSDFSDKNLGLLFDYIKEMVDEDEPFFSNPFRGVFRH